MNIWKVISISLILILVITGLVFGGLYLKNNYKLKWQQEAYQVGIIDGQVQIMQEQKSKGIVFVLDDSNNVTAFKITGVEPIQPQSEEVAQ